ncbi:MAG: methionyl-tRNA formyltransferase [Candidatus Electrothrix sp. AW2]|jgi:methionyl-tRNA formyltransferase|nr:methionyl-tRNA formyltransferase [Candidatus Electrothrix sp. AX1]MCI5136011.1 methionyl-tRNA formyltransferase [Candidatus Electrothrix gigas]MCI5180101.1 methionyl-tRNA formyltransferase [Candidatus Electrothrix gigas]MCI5182129.1 methionyl-tRNA formyltransferase [Candidatus Electrothrix gigas]MCI5192670.1 methionyl-tRNA formyltransferase [Candidatus Electrothrix gigas]
MSDPLRIVFMGTPDFAVPSLHALLDCPEQVVGVVCQPDRKQGRGKKLCPPPVKVLAEQAGIPILQPTCICDDAFLNTISALEPDLIVVTAYGRILQSRLLHLPRFGTINVHGSLLPKYRGAAPIQWAIINGETETGVTVMQMDEGVDTGDILLPLKIPITAEDTSGTLFDKLADLGGQALFEAISRIKRGDLPPTPQDDALSCPAPMLNKEMGQLDWSKSAQELHCLIRGLDPWPSAYGFIDKRRFRFFKPHVIPGKVQEKPGTLCRADKKGVLIATGKDYLLIREIQPEGKKRMCVQACICGMKLPIGEQFS